MLKLFVGTLLIVFAAQSVQAQVTVDVSKITCEQFNVLEKQDWSRSGSADFIMGRRANQFSKLTCSKKLSESIEQRADKQTISNGALWSFTRAASQSSYRCSWLIERHGVPGATRIVWFGH